jgi:hypothetical protein
MLRPVAISKGGGGVIQNYTQQNKYFTYTLLYKITNTLVHAYLFMCNALLYGKVFKYSINISNVHFCHTYAPISNRT